MCTTSNENSQARILIAVDDSPPSRWAVETGGRLAEQFSARVLLLHVMGPSAAVMDVPVSADELDGRALVGAMLLSRMRSLLPASVHCDCMQLSGNAAAEIIEVAENSDAHLIVMGTRGRGRLSQLLLGSTAEDVVRGSKCPVVTVGHEPKWVRADHKKCCGRCAGEKSNPSQLITPTVIPA